MAEWWQKSESDNWWTPLELFEQLDEEFHFTVDAAASAKNALCDRYYTKRDNGLAQSWKNETVWCNPPYGRMLPKFVEKAHQESFNGATTVLLIPARVDTSYWHDFIFGKAEIRFVRGRLKFEGPLGGGSAPFPAAVVVFRKQRKKKN
jgi:phage N-6-adenine-methyltransferase